MGLTSDHEEADTRLLLHAKCPSEERTNGRIVFHSPDTDVLALCVAHFADLVCSEFWFKTGVRDRLHCIPFHKVAIPPSPSLEFERGKHGVPHAHQESFGQLGLEHTLNDTTIEKCETFVCDLYPCSQKRTAHTADELRYLLFCQKKQKNELLPPTSGSLLQHVK